MFTGRKDELKQLEAIYSTDHSNLLMLYGREGIGKTALAQHFSASRHSVYFKVSEVSEQEQEKKLGSVLSALLATKRSDDEKKILIIDEFQLVTSTTVVSKLLEVVKKEEEIGRYMILLLSSSINWVENRMLKENRELAKSITGIIKLRPLKFSELVEWFPKASVEDCVTILALLGGIPKYLTLWQENRRAKENIISLFFNPESILKNEAEFQLKLELRELGAYNTILTALASGRYKLSEIYDYTGFNRAKISVYLKNLIEMDFVEKIFSVNVKNSENTKKGLYRIKDNFLNFYYAYVFPNISDIECGKGRNVYNDYLLPDFDRIMRANFADVCREYLELMSKYKRLGYKYSEWRSWFGKKGTIDIIGIDNERHMIASICTYGKEKDDLDTLKEFKNLISDAGIKPQKLCIFSKSGFESELLKKAKEENIMTVAMNEL